MGLFDFFKRKPSVPKAPKPPEDAAKIMLKTGRVTIKNESDLAAVFGGGVRISGRVVDLRGAVLDGSKLPKPKDSQDESASSLIVDLPGFSLVNGWVKSIPGGITVRSMKTSFKALKFTDIGEDALSTTTERAMDTRIEACEFWNDAGGDKSVQLNQAHGAVVRNCLFVGGVTAMRLQKTSYETQGARCVVSENRFEACDTGINASGGVRVTGAGNKFKSVRLKTKTSNGAKVSLS